MEIFISLIGIDDNVIRCLQKRDSELALIVTDVNANRIVGTQRYSR